jgi:hypothetical protein
MMDRTEKRAPNSIRIRLSLPVTSNRTVRDLPGHAAPIVAASVNPFRSLQSNTVVPES